MVVSVFKPSVPPSSRSLIGWAAGACLALELVSAPAYGFETVRRLPDGWDGTLELGADATSGASRTTRLSLDTRLGWNAGRFETSARLRIARATASLLVPREADGEPVQDRDGEPAMERVEKRTTDRRALSLEPRWYLADDRYYAFGLFDYETDPPAGVERSAREVLGVGYRLWEDKKNYLAAGIGVGHKRLEATDGELSDGGIGYLGVRLVLQLNEDATLDAGLDTDFGGDADLTEASLALGYGVREGAVLKLGYQARVNGGVAERAGSSSGGLDGHFSVKLALDVL